MGIRPHEPTAAARSASRSEHRRRIEGLTGTSAPSPASGRCNIIDGVTARSPLKRFNPHRPPAADATAPASQTKRFPDKSFNPPSPARGRCNVRAVRRRQVLVCFNPHRPPAADATPPLDIRRTVGVRVSIPIARPAADATRTARRSCLALAVSIPIARARPMQRQNHHDGNTGHKVSIPTDRRGRCNIIVCRIGRPDLRVSIPTDRPRPMQP